MNSDPSDQDRSTSDARRQQEASSIRAEHYRLDHHEAYREHTAKRRAASIRRWEEAERLYPSVGEIRKAHRHARLFLRKWDKANPNPLTWEEYDRLTNEFAAATGLRDTS